MWFEICWQFKDNTASALNRSWQLFEIAKKRAYLKSEMAQHCSKTGVESTQRPQLASPVTSHLWRVSGRVHFITRRPSAGRSPVETHCWTSSDKRRTTHLRPSACCVTTSYFAAQQPPQQTRAHIASSQCKSHWLA